MKTILFRADSSSNIGTGHIKRDLVLAKKYEKKSYKVIFASLDLIGNINHEILSNGYKLMILKSNSKKELINLIKKIEVDILVFDNYNINNKFEKYIKDKTKVKILSFDDTYQKHYCDILINHNIGANKEKYKKLLPKNCKIKCGTKYTLLRDEFKKEKNKIYKSNKKFTFFIAMGGADTQNLNIKILKILSSFNNIKINIITTSANINLTSLKEYCYKKKYISLYINSNKIAKIMKKSNFAIITPSVILNEVYFMNLPFLAIKTASNQQYLYKYLKNNKYQVLKKYSNELFYIKINNVLNNIILKNFINLNNSEMSMILRWRNHINIRKWMFNKDIITIDSHINFINTLDKNKEKKYFLVQHNENNIGIINFSNIKKDTLEIGIYSNPDISKVGDILLNEIIKYSITILKIKYIYAEVYSNNFSAIKLYKRFNFREVNVKKNIIYMEYKNENRKF